VLISSTSIPLPLPLPFAFELGVGADPFVWEPSRGICGSSDVERKNLRSETEDLWAGMMYCVLSARRSHIRTVSSPDPVATWYLIVSSGHSRSRLSRSSALTRLVQSPLLKSPSRVHLVPLPYALFSCPTHARLRQSHYNISFLCDSLEIAYPEATSAPSSWKVKAYTSLLCPSCVINSFCLATSHNLHVPSNDAEPRYAPEGWKATRPTRFECPLNDANGLSLFRQYHLRRYESARLTRSTTII
jgi:hypothetical protein